MKPLRCRRAEIAVMTLAFVLVAGCDQQDSAHPSEVNLFPEHNVDYTSLAPKTGKRVDITVPGEISREDCIALTRLYASDGKPDGQIVVRKTSEKLGGAVLPWCVENFDGAGPVFHDAYFN